MRTASVLLILAAIAAAEHSLFDPVPDDLLRPLAPDRPFATQGPFTVDAGRVQVEIDFFTYSRKLGTQGARDTRLRTFNLVPFNIKVGVLDNVDVQLRVQALRFERLEVFDPTTSVEREGAGDLVFRVKVNLWGNDSRDCALAVMPWVKIPSAQDELGNDEFEGGVMIPYFRRFGGGFTAGAKLEFDAVRDDTGTETVLSFAQSAYVRHNVLEHVDAFVEVTSAWTDGNWTGTVNFGVIYTITERFILDLGGSLGLNDRATNSTIWVGATIRF